MGKRDFAWYLIDGESYPRTHSITDMLSKPELLRWAVDLEKKTILQAVSEFYLDILRVRDTTGDVPSSLSFDASLAHRVGSVREHVKVMQRSQDIGTQAHALCEWYLLSKLIPETPGGIQADTHPQSVQCFNVFRSWFEKQDLHPVFVEFIVHSVMLCYAGTMDFLCKRSDGSIVLGDIKTSNALYPEDELQVTAYAHAVNEMGHGPVKEAFLIRLPKLESDPEPEIRMVNFEGANWEAFQAARVLWEWREGHKRPKKTLVEAVREEQKKNWERSIEQRQAILKHEEDLVRMAAVMDPKAIVDGVYTPKTLPDEEDLP